MAELKACDDFLRDAALTGGVIVDVRTPAEYASGHIVEAVNMPLFDNQERAEVGTLYLRVGKEQAVERGLEIVGIRLADIVRQARALAGGKRLFLYCWRGGMRSGSVAWLLEAAGMNVTLLKGGYKGYRREFEHMLSSVEWSLVLLSGATGCGKTELLARLVQDGQQVLDLEALACHKGSVFGGFGQQPQPTTEHFINLLHHQFLTFDPSKPIWCEGESMLIGHVFLPQRLYELMHMGKQIEVVMDIEQRLDRLAVEYGHFSTDTMCGAFEKIQKRMGREQVAAAIALLHAGDIRGAARLALTYYDKAYKKSAPTMNSLTLVADNDDMKHSAQQLLKLL